MTLREIKARFEYLAVHDDVFFGVILVLAATEVICGVIVVYGLFQGRFQ